MLDDLTGTQLAEWEAYNLLEPIGREWQEDLRLARTLSFLENMFLSALAKKGTYKASTPADFMPRWGEPIKKTKEKKQSAEDMKIVLSGFLGPSKKGK